MDDYQFNHCNGDIEYDDSTNTTTNIFVGPASEVPELTELKNQLAAVSKQVPAETAPFRPLIESLAFLFKPAKIFMLKKAGITNTDLDMYIELIVIVSDNHNISFSELRPALDLALLNQKRVSYSLHGMGSVMESLKKGHIFYSLHCTAKTLVYDDGKTKLPLTSATALQKMKEDVWTTFMTGFNKAFSFYQSAVHLQEFNQSPIMLFFLHQSVEFIYRSILRSLNGYDKQTHSIRRLKMYAQRCAPQLNAIFPDDSTEEKHIMDTLEGCYLKPRYEDGFSVSKEDIQALFSKARLLQACAKGIVEDAVV